MTEIPKCPTCGRRPSERTDVVLAGETTRKCVVTPICPDPIHDAADLGPAAVALLREWLVRIQRICGDGVHGPWAIKAQDLLASLPVKPPESLHIASCAPIHNRHGSLCGLCDSTHEHSHPQMRCVKCGTEGLAENMREHRCVTESKS